MTTIQNHIELNRPAEEVYDLLADCNNHEQLMPENIYNWSSTKDEAQFTIKNMAKLTLRIAERVSPSEIRFVPAEKAPFDVEMKWVITSTGTGTSTAQLIIQADLNMMMKMVATGPLQKLVDHQVKRLAEVIQ